MTREQRRLVEATRATTTDFAALARTRDEFVGGMQWITVKGNEYLTRYRRDALSGDQKSTSLGRRSKETEAIYKRFIDGRAEFERRTAELRPTMAEQARMAKALRLSRTPSEIADVARAIGFSDLADQVSIIGEAAVYGYECELAALLPREMLPDESMDLLVVGVEADDVAEGITAVLRRGKVSVRRRDAAELRTEEGLRIRLFTPAMLDRAADSYSDQSAGGAEAARWALDQPAIRSICIDRQGRAAPVSLLEPRAYCMLRFMALDVEEMSLIRREASTELNTAVVKLVHERWTEPFAEDHIQTIGPLQGALGEDGFPSAPRM
ncbi:GSU2403 family nucleotidyltransferase fold protein [Bradyrhizobium sp. AS23.2]|uniref:GSU2403 family nucleotidyltransferase fold protein n=1 Tax=Bradyrhizobium sp. AS23.2 TaxID=1680155 RepID=UPI00143057DB|nr:GSU2403 family nucleotidyltransferase fold protein [Bradyrhizobium sp. AS23.2]